MNKKNKFIGEWNKSVLLTYVGMACAVMGIYLAFTDGLKQAFLCLIVAGVCDLFDGAIARKCKRTEEQKLFGIQLDSLVDVISFLALPICISLRVGMVQWYHIIVLIVFAVCGIARLAFFNVHSEETPGFYRGVPVTYVALVLPLINLLSLMMTEKVFVTVYSVALIGIAFLHIFDIKVRKPAGVAYIFFALLAVGTCILYLTVLP